MIREGLVYDDVLLVPQHSTIESRSTIDLSVKLHNLKFSHPIIPANMQTVSGLEMCIAVIESGGLAILNRFMLVEEQIFISKIIINKFKSNNFAISIGIKNEDFNNIQSFYEVGVRIVCIDIAHGDSEQSIKMIANIKKCFPDISIIAGNVATASGAERLWQAGADIIKAGIGGGSLCTTRIETGNGVPQLTALMDISERRKRFPNKYIIADGGIKNSGDSCKALCFADMVMVGNMFAGCDETPGNVIDIDGKKYKKYVGSSTHKNNYIEGVSALVPYKGSFKTILTKMLEGIQSGMSYQNAHNLIELKENPEFIRITNAGLIESHPHDVIVIKENIK